MTFTERYNKALKQAVENAGKRRKHMEEYVGGVPGFEEESESEVRKQREAWTDEDWLRRAAELTDMGEFGDEWRQQMRAMRKDGA